MHKDTLLFSLIAIALDQISKIIIASNFNLYESFKIINNFNITYVNNYGAAWGIFDNSTLILAFIGIIASIFIYFVFVRNEQLSKLQDIFYGLLIGGILGNVVDRIVRGHVIDFIDVKIFGYNFPIFNLADTFIVISIIYIIISLFRNEGKYASIKY
ncbi:MAG: signal peptidase II [Bacilli bacterium]|nr:signal peptidase II [Bacilli bacterium]